MAMTPAEKQKAYRDRERYRAGQDLGASEVRVREAEMAAETEALCVSKPVSSRAEAVRAKAVVEALCRGLIEAAEAASKSGVLSDAGKVWVRGQVSVKWDLAKARLAAADEPEAA